MAEVTSLPTDESARAAASTHDTAEVSPSQVGRLKRLLAGFTLDRIESVKVLLSVDRPLYYLWACKIRSCMHDGRCLADRHT